MATPKTFTGIAKLPTGFRADEAQTEILPVLDAPTLKQDKVDDRGDNRPRLALVPAQPDSKSRNKAGLAKLLGLTDRVKNMSAAEARAYWLGFGDGVREVSEAPDDTDQLSYDVSLVARMDALIRKYSKRPAGAKRTRDMQAELNTVANGGTLHHLPNRRPTNGGAR